MLIDLTQENLPVIKEISAIEQLMNDPENYVMSGIETDILPNIQASFYLYEADLYKSFNELDLNEMIRLKE